MRLTDWELNEAFVYPSEEMREKDRGLVWRACESLSIRYWLLVAGEALKRTSETRAED